MPKVLILLAGLVGFFFASGADAQPRIQRGSQELSVHISPDFEGAIGDMIFAQAGYGWFVRDGLAARATLSYTVLEDVAGEDSDYRSSEAGVAAEYHFGRDSRFIPYLGAGLGWRRTQFNKLDEAALVYGPLAGIKYFLADNVALDLEVTYKLGAADVFINDFVAEDTDLSSVIGLRVLF
jgi:opacity protein-like surface antigen